MYGKQNCFNTSLQHLGMSRCCLLRHLSWVFAGPELLRVTQNASLLAVKFADVKALDVRVVEKKLFRGLVTTTKITTYS